MVLARRRSWLRWADSSADGSRGASAGAGSWVGAGSAILVSSTPSVMAPRRRPAEGGKHAPHTTKESEKLPATPAEKSMNGAPIEEREQPRKEAVPVGAELTAQDEPAEVETAKAGGCGAIAPTMRVDEAVKV
jgi:hypothetical protein